MRKEQIEDNENIIKLYPDDGYKITNFVDGKNDITEFAVYSSVITLSEREKNYYEISTEAAAELMAKRDEALKESNETNGEEEIYDEYQSELTE